MNDPGKPSWTRNPARALTLASFHELAGKARVSWLLSGELCGRWVFCIWWKLRVIWTRPHHLGLGKGRRSDVSDSTNILLGRERAELQIPHHYWCPQRILVSSLGNPFSLLLLGSVPGCGQESVPRWETVAFEMPKSLDPWTPVL